jgi:hypothetical protein
MTRGREQRTAPILSHGQTTSGQCGFNQAASHPADPIKRHRARRERRHPKAMLTTQTSAVALDLLENTIGPNGHRCESRQLMSRVAMLAAGNLFPCNASNYP